jgi:peptide/nickel transport system permease protein
VFSFIINKFLQALAILGGVLLIVFFLFFVLLPTDPARLTMGQRSDAKTLENTRKEMYLDKPLHTQFALYVNDLMPIAIHENSEEAQKKYDYKKILSLSATHCAVVKWPFLRRSYQTKKPVSTMLWEAFPGTLILATLAIVVAAFFGIILGTIAAVKKGTIWDSGALFTSVLGISAPSFFAGVLVAYVFGFLLHQYTGLEIISPLYDYQPYEGKRLVLKSLILPVFTLAIRPIAIITQITRSSMLDVLNQDYIRTAKAKGVSRFNVLFKHALPNALNPIITSISGWFAELLAGSFFIEYIFGWKGIGKLSVDALNKFDFPVVMGSVLFTACIFIVVNILVDISYRIIDPRIQR